MFADLCKGTELSETARSIEDRHFGFVVGEHSYWQAQDGVASVLIPMTVSHLPRATDEPSRMVQTPTIDPRSDTGACVIHPS